MHACTACAAACTPRKPMLCTTPRTPNRARTNLAHCCCVAASASLCAGTAHCPRTTTHNKAHGAGHTRLSVQCNTRHDRTAAELRRWARAAEMVEYTHTASMKRCQQALPHERGRITPATVPQGRAVEGDLADDRQAARRGGGLQHVAAHTPRPGTSAPCFLQAFAAQAAGPPGCRSLS